MMSDLFSAREARDEALERVEANANLDWKEEAFKAVVLAATELRQLTADDVYDRLPSGIFTHEPRALGPVMLRALRDSLIIKANVAARPSRRRSLHASPRTVWDSQIFDGALP
jgi:hypothetical protein